MASSHGKVKEAANAHNGGGEEEAAGACTNTIGVEEAATDARADTIGGEEEAAGAHIGGGVEEAAGAHIGGGVEEATSTHIGGGVEEVASARIGGGVEEAADTSGSEEEAADTCSGEEEAADTSSGEEEAADTSSDEEEATGVSSSEEEATDTSTGGSEKVGRKWGARQRSTHAAANMGGGEKTAALVVVQAAAQAVAQVAAQAAPTQVDAQAAAVQAVAQAVVQVVLTAPLLLAPSAPCRLHHHHHKWHQWWHRHQHRRHQCRHRWHWWWHRCQHRWLVSAPSVALVSAPSAAALVQQVQQEQQATAVPRAGSGMAAEPLCMGVKKKRMDQYLQGCVQKPELASDSGNILLSNGEADDGVGAKKLVLILILTNTQLIKVVVRHQKHLADSMEELQLVHDARKKLRDAAYVYNTGESKFRQEIVDLLSADASIEASQDRRTQADAAFTAVKADLDRAVQEFNDTKDKATASLPARQRLAEQLTCIMEAATHMRGILGGDAVDTMPQLCAWADGLTFGSGSSGVGRFAQVDGLADVDSLADISKDLGDMQQLLKMGKKCMSTMYAEVLSTYSNECHVLQLFELSLKIFNVPF
ncbi:hypothetical protein PLESTF_001692900 [Pleodorina starrii]|nr:hypothetical protein PLESTF_001692900 [Pleodorina starrii]